MAEIYVGSKKPTNLSEFRRKLQALHFDAVESSLQMTHGSGGRSE